MIYEIWYKIEFVIEIRRGVAVGGIKKYDSLWLKLNNIGSNYPCFNNVGNFLIFLPMLYCYEMDLPI